MSRFTRFNRGSFQTAFDYGLTRDERRAVREIIVGWAGGP
jgi:hypothetical protein